jgi:hypothetical protein
VATLVLDEQFTSNRLILALEDRGMGVKTVADFGAEGRPDPDVVWVLVTMDTTILEDFAGFDWSRYAIAWVVIDDHLLGAAVEKAKSNVVQRHAHMIVEQKPNDPLYVFGRTALKTPAEPRKAAGKKGGQLVQRQRVQRRCMISQPQERCSP